MKSFPANVPLCTQSFRSWWWVEGALCWIRWGRALIFNWFLEHQLHIGDKLQKKTALTHEWFCFLKVLVWRTMVLIFQMGKMLKRPRCRSACQTPPSLLPTPPRIFAHRPSQCPRLRSSSLLLSTRRNSHQHPPPPTQPLPPPTWSVACRQSGDCPSPA